MPYIYWLLGAIFYFYQFIFRTIFSTLGDEVTQKFEVSLADLSYFFSVGMLAYSLMQIPGGILLDRFGPRRILTSAMAILSIGVILIGTTHSFSIAILGRILIGVGSAFGFLGTSKIVTMWFSLQRMGFLLGSTIFLGALGGALSRDFFEAMSIGWDWQKTLLNMGLLGLLFTLLLWYFLKEKNIIEDQKYDNYFLPSFKMIASNKQILLAAFFAFFAYLPVSLLGDSWGALAFEKMFEVEKSLANKTITYFYISFAIGAIFYSSLPLFLKNSRKVLLFEFTLAAFFLYLLIGHVNLGKMEILGIPGFLILTSLVAFNSGGVSLCFPIGCSHAPKMYSATVVGFMNMLCMISGSLFSKIIGNFLKYFSIDFPAKAFQYALTSLILTSIIAVILLVFMHEKEDSIAG